jgi:hypothetical protein
MRLHNFTLDGGTLSSRRSTLSPNIGKIQATYKMICPGMTNGPSFDFQAPHMMWKDVLLIIVFTEPLYHVIPYTEVIYRPFFPQILYCGPHPMNYTTFPELRYYNIYLVAYGANVPGRLPGLLGQKCLIMATEMPYKVRGFLTMYDDLMLLLHRIKDLDLEKAWYQSENRMRIANMKTLKQCINGTCNVTPDWAFWQSNQNQTINALNELMAKQNESILIQNCHKNLTLLNQGEYIASMSYSDMYYVPKYLVPNFVKLTAIFLKHDVLFEIAISTVYRCLVPEIEKEILVGLEIWGKTRLFPWNYIKKLAETDNMYLHPTKWSYLDQHSANYTTLFCNFVSYLHDPEGNNTSLLRDMC